jgi:quercetin 2,3-dioxygenase
MTLSLEDERPFLLEVPQGHTAFAFLHTGRASIGPEGAQSDVGAGTLAVLGEGNRIRIRAAGERAGLVVAAAQPLHEPIVQSGPFVMNTEEEIAKAWADYRDGVLDRG